MSNGSGELGEVLRLPFYRFLPDMMLGLGLLYVLYIANKIELVELVMYSLPATLLPPKSPTWLVGILVTALLVGLGEVIAMLGDSLVFLFFSSVDTSRGILEFEYKKDHDSEFPVTMKYNPFSENDIDTEVLWYTFRGDKIRDVSERDFNIIGTLFSGLSWLSLLYLALSNLAMLVLVLVTIFLLGKTTIGNKILRIFLMNGWIFSIVILGLVLISRYFCSDIVNTIMAGTISVMSLAFSILVRSYANALNYTHYIKMKEREKSKQ